MLIILNGLKYTLYGLKKYRWWLFSLIYMAGFFLYHFVCHLNILASLFRAATLFTLNIYTDIPEKSLYCLDWLYGVGLMAGFYTVLSLISLIAKRYIDKQYVFSMQQKPYILVCGLGKKASAYIESELENGNNHIIAIEISAANQNIEKYRQKGIAVIVSDAKDKRFYEELRLDNIKHIVVLAGSDIDNLEIALVIKEVLIGKKIDIKQLFMHIDDRSIDKFYKDGGLLNDASKLEVKMFSMARSAAKELFLKHAVDGIDRTYMESAAPFSLVVVGSTRVAVEIIGQICQLAHFPFENKVKIYCIDSNTKKLKQNILHHFPEILKIPNITMEFFDRDPWESLFYEDDLWYDNVANIILCKEKAQENLDIAAELADRTYLHAIIEGTMKTMIHIATYDNDMIAEQINQNSDHFKYFHAFAQVSKTASKEAIVDEKFEQIAKYIHSGYTERYAPDTLYEESALIREKWYKHAKLTDRESSRAQAYHIPVKLKALGLSYRNSAITDHQKLLVQNRKILNSVIGDELKQLGFDEKHLKEITAKYDDWDTFKKEFTYFPETFDLLIEKLIRTEKNRWNAHHYLKGWKYTPEKTSKPLKQHRCLTPIEQMHKEDRFTILYDLYATLYMPNLLASVGYEIIKGEEKPV